MGWLDGSGIKCWVWFWTSDFHKGTSIMKAHTWAGTCTYGHTYTQINKYFKYFSLKKRKVEPKSQTNNKQWSAHYQNVCLPQNTLPLMGLSATHGGIIEKMYDFTLEQICKNMTHLQTCNTHVHIVLSIRE